MARRYQIDELLWLRSSPLVTKPASLPPVEEWMGCVFYFVLVSMIMMVIMMIMNLETDFAFANQSSSRTKAERSQRPD